MKFFSFIHKREKQEEVKTQTSPASEPVKTEPAPIDLQITPVPTALPRFATAPALPNWRSARLLRTSLKCPSAKEKPGRSAALSALTAIPSV